MIINFSIQNFGSVKDKQSLSFEADNSTHLEDSYIINADGLRLLKIALIYGANASGKTTILKALEFLRDIVLNPEIKKTAELDFEPFLFDSVTPMQNSLISIEFLQNEIKYFYEVEFIKTAIVREELYFYYPNKANIFKRHTNLINQYTEISFGTKIKRDKSIEKSLEANTLWNNTVLGGYLKTNVDIKEIKEAVDWFKIYLRPLIITETNLENFVTKRINNSELSKIDIINILKRADFHISDIVIHEEEDDIPNGFLDFLNVQLNNSDDKIKKIEKSRKFTRMDLEFEHTVKDTKYPLKFELESQGTQRYYGFAGLLALLIKNSIAFPIDELESSLHPDLYLHFIISFLLSSENSQIIATTHNRELLDNKDVFRNDSIWFTEKQDDGSTELYSLADFDSSVIRNTTNILNAYKSGKLKGTPHLGDNYFDLK
ncbi:MAG TPA: ATP-binding protein [Arachidicoccus sp.]|nr:ATP-binding protein [Arachidicoccus sp.]